ncbi:MAG: NPCBM/NEW2 domain-containing protein [Planctomycetaceae bacterium]|nr:NPCBM/NEW2 domain-containing protein [Planctomycetaceae bacterium]
MVWLSVMMAAGLWAAPATHTVEMVDAATVEGTLTAVTADKVELQSKDAKQSLPREQVVRITLAEADDPTARLGKAMVMTLDGAQLAADSVTMDQGTLTAAVAGVGSVQLPIAQVKAVYLPDAGTTVQDIRLKCEEFKIVAGAQDVLVAVKKDGGYVSVQGAVKAIDAAQVTFNWKDTDRRSARDTVRAVLLGQTGAAAPARAGGVVTLRNGSRLPWSSLTMDAKGLGLETAAFKRLTLDPAGVAEITFISDRVTDLAELAPDAVEQHGLLGEGFKYRRGRSVAGGPLRMNKKTYASGLGLHSFTSLSYNLDGRYRRLAALVGIDDAAAAAADATLVVLGDDKPLGQPLRLRSAQPPQVLRVDLAGVKRLTIRVEFGQDKLDVGDHVDIVAARLIK